MLDLDGWFNRCVVGEVGMKGEKGDPSFWISKGIVQACLND